MPYNPHNPVTPITTHTPLELCYGTNGVTASTISATTTTTIGTADVTHHEALLVSCYVSAAGTFYLDFSTDGGSNYDSTLTKTLAAGINEFSTVVKGSRTVRARIQAGASDITTTRLQVDFGPYRQGNLPLNVAISDDADAAVVREISEDQVMIGRVQGNYIISGFGRNGDVDAAEDIWNGGGDYTGFPTTTAEEFQVFSSDVNDTSAGTGARTVRVFYLDSNYEMFDSSGNYLYFDATLNGTTAVNTGVTGTRVWKAEVQSSGSGQTNAGDITIRWRTTTAVIFAVMPAGFAETQLSNFTVPAGYTGYLKRYQGSMSDNTANTGQMAIKYRADGTNTFRLTRGFAISTTKDGGPALLYGGIKYSAKTDLVFRATSVTNANAIINVNFAWRLVRN